MKGESRRQCCDDLGFIYFLVGAGWRLPYMDCDMSFCVPLTLLSFSLSGPPMRLLVATFELMGALRSEY